MKSKNIALVIFTIFSVSLFIIFIHKKYNEINAPKIVLESKFNPTEITKPKPTDSNLDVNFMEEYFENASLSDEVGLEVDSIE